MQTNVQPEAPAPTTDGVVIRTEGLTKVYDTGVKAVDALDLEVHEGEIFGLLGPNGAGKTTTVGMLTTRVIPTEGRATVAGVDVVAHPSVAKALMGVVSQTNTLDRSLTVWENLYFHGRYFGMGKRESKRVATQVLEVFRLADRAHADVSTLSGGMAQRLMVARSIVHRPRTLFLDEPTSGLDPQSRIALWEIIGQIHREGQTVVLTTHYMEEADRLCERVAIMDHGKLLALDTPDGLKRSVGGDSVVKIKAGTEPDSLAAHLHDLDGITGTTVIGETVQLTAQGVRRTAAPHHRDRGGGRLPRARCVDRRADARDGLHQPHREGPEGMSAQTTAPPIGLPTVAPYRSTPMIAFGALMLRDLTVLRKNFLEFILRTVMQPLLFVFVFTYVFPQIGQGVGGRVGAVDVLEHPRPGRDRDRVHLPGDPGRRPAAGPGVRVHARDRGSRHGAAAGVGGREREAPGRRGAGIDRRSDRLPARALDPGHRGASPDRVVAARHACSRSRRCSAPRSVCRSAPASTRGRCR